MRKAIALALVCLCAAAALAQEGDSAIVHGPDWAYLIAAPEGFKLDARSLRDQGIQGLFYAQGQEGYRGDLLNMYINPFPSGGDAPEGLEAFIAWDLDYFVAGNPGLKVSYYEDVELGDLNTCRVYALDDEGRGYYMLHGYAVEERASFVFVLVARSREERIAAEAAYRELLLSFVYLDKERE